MPSKKQCRHLLVVAHPDDETLFFAGLIQSLKDWHVVCVTDGNADGLGIERKEQFLGACNALKVTKAEMFGFPDIFEKRLNTYDLARRLGDLGRFKKVFTHSILGEYGHRHHQDVSFATHQVFQKQSKVYSLAYNCFPKTKVSLSQKQFDLKTKVLWEIYKGETGKLINYLPAHSTEGFLEVSFREVETIYFSLIEGKPIDKKAVKIFKWLIPYIESGNATLRARPF